MSRTIDERIVQMTFNNKEFEDRAKTTMSTLDKLKAGLSFGSSAIGLTNLQKAASGVNLTGISSAVTTITDKFSALETLAVGALFNIGQKASDAGIRLVKSLSIENVAKGWEKYNQQTQSVQTLVNSTGKSVEEIDGYLDRLMWYSDETSFGFTDMTKALGTMVSSGGDIEKLIPMLMGIGNATAFAGKGAEEFQRVIYNLNQSYSSGYLNTIDWKSLSGASVDSKELKEQLLGAAVELGKINKSQAKLENFSKLMSDKVFDRNVMELAFGRFAEFTLKVEEAVRNGEYATASEAMEALSGSVEKFAEDAFIAGQSSKSFREAIDATKDAVSSGWMDSFKVIFGNYEESKALWTDVTTSLWDWFASGADSRNKVLKEWKSIWTGAVEAKKAYNSLDDKKKQFTELDGFYQNIDDSLTQTQALWKAFSSAVDNIRKYISSVWNEVFEMPGINEMARTLFNFLERIRSGLISIGNAFGPKQNQVVTNIGKAFTGVLKVIKMIITAAREFNKSFIAPLADRFKPIILDIFDIFGNIGDMLSSVSDNVTSDLSPLQKIFKGILDILDPIISGISKFVKWIKELTSQTSEINVFGGIFKTIGNVFEFIGNTVKNISFDGIKKALGEIFSKIKDTISSFLESNGMDASKLFGGGLLAGIIYGLVNSIKGAGGGGIGGIIDIFDTISETFSSITEAVNKFSESIKIALLKEISNALLKLAGALFIISLVDSDKIVSSLASLGAVIGEMLGAIYGLNKMGLDSSINSAASTFNKISVGLLLISVAMKVLSSISPQAMDTGLKGLTTSLFSIMIFIAALNKMTKGMRDVKLATLGAVFKQLGWGLIEIALALKIVSTIDADKMSSTLIMLGASLGGLLIFIVALNKMSKGMRDTKLTAIGTAFVALSGGLILISVALKLLSTIDLGNMIVALVGLFGILGAVALFTKLVNGNSIIAVSTGLLIMSVALIPFAGVMMLLGKMSLGEIGKALLALAAGLAILGGLGALLSAVAPEMLIFSGALLAMSLALIPFAIALKTFGSMKMGQIAKALLTLAGSLLIVGLLSTVLSVTAPFILAVAGAIAAFGLGLSALAAGIIAIMAAFAMLDALGMNLGVVLLEIITEIAEALILVVPTLINGLIESIIKSKTKFIELGIELIDALVIALNESIPKLIEAGINLITQILTAIRDNIYQLSELGVEMIDEVNRALNDNGQRIADGFFEALINAINILADTIKNNAGRYGEAIGNLAASLITSLVDALWGMIKGVGGGLWDAISGLFTGDEKEVQENGAKSVESYATGVESQADYLNDVMDTVSTDAVNQMDQYDLSKYVGDNTIQGYIDAAKNPNNIQMTYDAYYGLVKQGSVQGMKDAAAVKSPSKEARKIGDFIVQGLILGLNDNAEELYDSSNSIGSSMIASLRTAITTAESILDDDLNPVITPVLDLSNIQGNAGAISDMMNANASLNGALAINSLGRNGLNQNGVKPTAINVNFTVNNAGRDLDDSTIARYSKQIAKAVNEELGGMIA